MGGGLGSPVPTAFLVAAQASFLTGWSCISAATIGLALIRTLCSSFDSTFLVNIVEADLDSHSVPVINFCLDPQMFV